MLFTDFFKTIQEQSRIRLQYGPEYIGDQDKIETGLSTRYLVLQDNYHSLYLYPGKKDKNIPVLFVYSLINRPYIFDLAPGRSMIEYLCEQGFDVYLLDWGNPDTSASCLSITDLVAGTLHRCVSYLKNEYSLDKINILGYCMGSTFATLYAGLKPENIDKLVLLTPPLAYENGAILQKIASRIKWSAKFENAGIINGRLLKNFFNLIKPANALKKERDFWRNYDQEIYLKHFLPVEKWSNDTPDLPGKVFFEFLNLSFVDNSFKKRNFNISDYSFDMNRINFPVFSVAAQHDWIIPSSSLDTVREIMPNAEHQSYLLPGGHIGLVIGRTAPQVWEKVKDFFISSL